MNRCLLLAITLLLATVVSELLARPTPSFAAIQNPGTGLSTNYDWAALVLRDGSWPVSSNNVTVITQWMASEEPPSNWWNRNNPLNNGLGSGGGSGLGSYSDLATAAYYVALNLESSSFGYPAIAGDLAASAAPSVTAAAIWNSQWASGHYGYGTNWYSGTVASVAAPASAWVASGTYADGMILRGQPSNTLHLMEGGAQLFLSLADCQTLVLNCATGFQDVTDGTISGLPTTPVDGTLLRGQPSNTLHLVEGGAELFVRLSRSS